MPAQLASYISQLENVSIVKLNSIRKKDSVEACSDAGNRPADLDRFVANLFGVYA